MLIDVLKVRFQPTHLVAGTTFQRKVCFTQGKQDIAAGQQPSEKSLKMLPARPVLADLPTHRVCIAPDFPVRELQLAFEQHPNLPAVIIGAVHRPLGLISRDAFMREMSRRSGWETYEEQPVRILIEDLAMTTLRLPHSMEVAAAARKALCREEESAFEPFLVDHADGSTSVVDMRTLLLAQSLMLERATQLEEKLRQSSKLEAIGQLAGGIAHDFNNLLTVIQGNAEILRMRLSLTEEEGELFESLNQAVFRAADLTGRLLGFSRRAASKQEVVRVNDCVEETIRMLRRVIDPRIVVTLECAPDLWAVQADSTQLNQLLMNLCVNARDAMPNGGRLFLATDNVTLRPQDLAEHADGYAGEFVRLQVTDTGTGIPLDLLPRIYEPFFTTKEAGRGTGLGLAMTYAIVQQCKGWIECRSTVGVGTGFTVYLPRCRQEVSSKAHSDGISPRSTGNETILVVDDEEMIRNMVARLLRSAGFQVLTATDGIEALDLFSKEKASIDLVLLDLTMPRLSGEDTLRELRRLDPNVSVLVCSGCAVQWRALKHEQGVLGCVEKPFRASELILAIRTALTRAART